MIIKVCGLNNQNNAQQVTALDIDMVGLNFYRSSPRYVSSHFDIPTHIKKVGVFVNAPLNEIKEKVKVYGLDYIQCHGNETPKYCADLAQSIGVIKVFSIKSKSDFDKTQDYAESSLFLFDTKTKGFGGSGRKFNWQLLNYYQGDIPFLLAGGIQPEDAEEIKQIAHTSFYGVDINSGFENSPGMKNSTKIKQFITELKR